MASYTQVILMAIGLMAVQAADLSWPCTQAGVFCKTCVDVVMCVDTGSGFQDIPVASCSNDTFCSHSLKECSANYTGPCNNAPVFTCHSKGLFPDPYDCNVYYTCGESNSAEYPFQEQHFCPSGYAFDSLWGSCILSTTHRVCTESPVPTCVEGLLAGNLVENPTMYYICVEGSPKLYQCDNGGTFDNATFACDTSTFHCPGVGEFPDPKNCHKWYECANPTEAKHESCFIGFYYDPAKKRCILGMC